MVPEPPFEPLHVKLGNEEYFFAPASASDARAHALLPSQGSEDVSHLLGPIDLPPRRPASDEDQDYLPNAATEWILDIRFAGEPRLTPTQVERAFHKHWERDCGAGTLYGFNPEQGHWTFVICGDGPKVVTHLKLGLDYFPSWQEDATVPTVLDFQRREAAARRHAATLGTATVTPNVPAEEAARRAQLLSELKSACDAHIALILKAPAGQPFDGRQVWDVMLCLGLRWGDMDCFHWENPSDAGDEHLFSVETSTPPGYFLPEEIAAGRVQVEDLIFVYSLPRCARPIEVFDGMFRAATYCQQRLGGQILDANEEPVDLQSSRSEIRELCEHLTGAGFPPGSENALRLF